MIEYNKVNAKWSDSQLNKLKSSDEKQTGVTLRMNIVPLGITAGPSTIDAEIQKKIHGCGTTTLTTLNEEINDIMKTVPVLEGFNVWLKGITKTIKKET